MYLQPEQVPIPFAGFTTLAERNQIIWDKLVKMASPHVVEIMSTKARVLIGQLIRNTDTAIQCNLKYLFHAAEIAKDVENHVSLLQEREWPHAFARSYSDDRVVMGLALGVDHLTQLHEYHWIYLLVLRAPYFKPATTQQARAVYFDSVANYRKWAPGIPRDINPCFYQIVHQSIASFLAKTQLQFDSPIAKEVAVFDCVHQQTAEHETATIDWPAFKPVELLQFYARSRQWRGAKASLEEFRTPGRIGINMFESQNLYHLILDMKLHRGIQLKTQQEEVFSKEIGPLERLQDNLQRLREQKESHCVGWFQPTYRGSVGPRNEFYYAFLIRGHIKNKKRQLALDTMELLSKEFSQQHTTNYEKFKRDPTLRSFHCTCSKMFENTNFAEEGGKEHLSCRNVFLFKDNYAHPGKLYFGTPPILCNCSE